jgi:hypothetical protein
VAEKRRADLGTDLEDEVEVTWLCTFDQLRRQCRDADASGQMSLAIEDRHAQCGQAYDEIINGQLPALLSNPRGLRI